MPLPKTTPQLIETAIRRNFVLKLRAAGKPTYASIANAAIAQFGADKLPKNYNAAQACRDVQAELDRIRKETSESAKQLRTLELMALDRMEFGIREASEMGDAKAVITRLKIMEQRAKYVDGLVVPQKIAPTTPDGEEEYEGGMLIYIPDNGRGDNPST
jgi:hypothetical protein